MVRFHFMLCPVKIRSCIRFVWDTYEHAIACNSGPFLSSNSFLTYLFEPRWKLLQTAYDSSLLTPSFSPRLHLLTTTPENLLPAHLLSYCFVLFPLINTHFPHCWWQEPIKELPSELNFILSDRLGWTITICAQACKVPKTYPGTMYCHGNKENRWGYFFCVLFKNLVKAGEIVEKFSKLFFFNSSSDFIQQLKLHLTTQFLLIWQMWGV